MLAVMELLLLTAVVPFRFGFRFHGLGATHTRTKATIDAEKERRNQYYTFIERNLYIPLNEWRSALPRIGWRWLRWQASSRVTIASLRFKSKQTEQKNCLAICNTEREGSHVHKIKDKRPIWPFNPFPFPFPFPFAFAFANKQPALYQLQGAAIDSHWCIGIIRFAHLLFGQTSVPPAICDWRCILSGTASIELAMKGSIKTYEIVHRYIRGDILIDFSAANVLEIRCRLTKLIS